MPKVVINYRGNFVLPDRQVEQWKRAFPGVEFYEFSGLDADGERLRDADAFIGNPTDDMLASMPRVRWVQLHGAGANLYANNPHLRGGVTLTNCNGVFGVPVSEHAVALMLALARRIHLHVKQQMDRVWKPDQRCLEVAGSNVAVLGLGDIGSETARRAKGLGARVIAVKRSASAKPAYVDELHTMADLDDVLKRSDFIVNALPLTADTRGLLTGERFRAMKRGAVFINVGRGETVDEPGLIDALESGHLEGAGLDVAGKEPLSQDSPLWSLPNVIITSHSANASPRKTERRIEIMGRNLAAFVSGEPLMNVVNRDLGY